MLRLTDYRNSYEFGKAVNEEFIVGYSADIEISNYSSFDCKEFLDGLFRKSKNCKLYCRILDNLNIIYCHPKQFNYLVYSLRNYISQYIQDSLIKEVFNKFVDRNRPFLITNLLNLDYVINIVDGDTIKNISHYINDDFVVELREGTGKFSSASIKSELFDRQVIYSDNKIIRYSKIDHSTGQVYLYC